MFPPDPPDRVSFSDLGLPPRTVFAADSAPRRLPRLEMPEACEPVNAQTLRPHARPSTWGWIMRGVALGSAVVVGMVVGLWWISATPTEPISAVIPRIGVPAERPGLAGPDLAGPDLQTASNAAVGSSASVDAPVAAEPSGIAPSTAVMLPEVTIAVAGSVVRAPSRPAASASGSATAASAAPESSEEASPATVPDPQPADLELPPHPPREAVLAAFEGARPAVLDCAGNRHGTAAVRVSLAPTGRARSVLVEGDFGGSPEGSCIARVLRSTTFPRFTEERVSIVYPYSL